MQLIFNICNKPNKKKEELRSKLRKCDIDATCSYIDVSINICEDIIAKLEKVTKDCSDKNLISYLKLTIGLLNYVAIGDNCELEKLRKMNEGLRKYAYEMYWLAKEFLE